MEKCENSMKRAKAVKEKGKESRGEKRKAVRREKGEETKEEG